MTLYPFLQRQADSSHQVSDPPIVPSQHGKQPSQVPAAGGHSQQRSLPDSPGRGHLWYIAFSTDTACAHTLSWDVPGKKS